MFGWAVLLAAQAGTAAPPAVLTFSVRADPSVAGQVNEVLAALARPTRSRVAATQDAASAIADRCGKFAAPAILSVTPDPARGSNIVEHKPCLLFRKNRDFVVRPGYTIEDLAVASGMRASSTAGARVQKPGSSEWKPVNPTLLSVGDKVRLSKVPAWTRVEVDASQVSSRDELVKRIAGSLKCPGEQPESCLRKRGVDVADDNASASNFIRGLPVRRAVGVALSPGAPRAAGPPPAAGLNVHGLAGAMAVRPPPPPGVMGIDGLAAVMAAPLPPPPPPPPGAAAPPPVAAVPVAAVAAVAGPMTDDVRNKAPVAPDQWPYDRALVAKILATDQGHAQDVAIGVADAGLGNSSGAPLPSSIFFRNVREHPLPDQVDDDDNSYVDDIDGAGVLRSGDLEPSGDLGVCTPAESIASLTGQTRSIADHGAIVASIASGWDIRRHATLGAGLPRLIFFRLLDDVCKSPPRLQATEADFLAAMDYVYERAPILVLSYTLASTPSSGFRPTVQEHLANSDNFLIIPAGNDGPGDLDQDPRCPACLADPNLTDRITVMRTIVVGNAQRDLTIAPSSNWGMRIVHLYAPGDAAGAVDIQGGDAASYAPATSWSAPYVGLAAGIMQSLGIERTRDLRERLLASSWPVIDSAGHVDPASSGVLNITAAAAVRHDAIEVIEIGASGTYERRTYVGTLDTSLTDLCPEGGLGPVHSIRFGTFNGTRRETSARSSTFDNQLKRFPTRTSQCTIPAQIHFTDLLRGSLTFDSNAVTHLLLAWL